MTTGECPGLPPEKYWCGEMHHVDEIGFDLKRNLRLYRPRGNSGTWIVDSRYRPGDEDYLMKRNIRLRKV